MLSKRILQISFLTLLIILGVTFYSKYCKKKQLEEKFLEDFMRHVPMNIFNIKSLDNFDVLYQKETSLSDYYNYRNCYVIGEKGNSFFNYDYCFSLTGINIFENAVYISNLVKKFRTDSTHVYSISVRNDTLSVVVSREKMNQYIAWKVCTTVFLKPNFDCREDVWSKSKNNRVSAPF